MNKILVISGPTATGKTQLAFKLAKKFNGELISADSRQVYKGMDIGTGKDRETESRIRIWGYDVVEPSGEWSAAHFVKLAQKLIPEIQSRGKLPIIVGGTGLYISNLLNPPETLNIPPDKKLRGELEKLPVDELQDRLKEINPERFASMNDSDQNNPRRLIRAIEVVKFPKLRSARFLDFGTFRRPFARNDDAQILQIGLTAATQELDRRIEERVRQRIEEGVEEEVFRLVKKYGWDSALKFTIGYKEWQLDSHGRSKRPRNDLSGQFPIEEIVKNWTVHEKQYARRQLTWMAKYSPDKLFDISRLNYYQDIEAYVSQWYHKK
jgi:tRNA dimethylallyltransferase